MGDIMTYCVRIFLASAIAFAGTTAAVAADLPAIKASTSNKVPACATPGRLMAFAGARNEKIADNFDGVATEYMRHGETLGLRWDYAFFQMMVETANLGFPGDVNAKQNNFAGLGATGGGEPGESFKTVSEGVKAHLQHVLMYTGADVSDAVAERTRKVQEWGVLTSWQKTISGPMTYTHLTRKWSPKDRGYSKDIASVADSFYSKFCEAKDPRPELVAEARGKAGVTVDTAAAIAPTRDGKSAKGAEAVKRAVADARETGDSERKALGAASIAATEPDTSASAAKPAAEPAKFTLLNSSEAAADETAEATAAANSQPPAKAAATASASAAKAEIKTASAAAAAAKGAAVMSDAAATAAKSTKGACRVWQASYGGEKAVIIKVVADGQTNYTVLDVNEGREQREVAAYIAAYAQDGNSVGEYPSPAKALSKAFEMCPEG